MSNVLDLSGADTSGFDAMDSGTYDATVYEVTMKETKGGEDAKLPGGTPMFNVQFRIEDAEHPEYTNRRCFRSFLIAPAKVNGKAYEHKAKMDGMLVRFFEAIGYSDDEIKSGGFSPSLDDMAGRECRVVVKKKQKYGTKAEDNEFDNEVTGVKPRSASESGGIL